MNVGYRAILSLHPLFVLIVAWPVTLMSRTASPCCPNMVGCDGLCCCKLSDVKFTLLGELGLSWRMLEHKQHPTESYGHAGYAMTWV